MNPNPAQIPAPNARREITTDDLCKHFKLNATIKALPLIVSALDLLKTSPLLADGVIPKVSARKIRTRLDYTCGYCGQKKKNHVCAFRDEDGNPIGHPVPQANAQHLFQQQQYQQMLQQQQMQHQAQHARPRYNVTITGEGSDDDLDSDEDSAEKPSQNRRRKASANNSGQETSLDSIDGEMSAGKSKANNNSNCNNRSTPIWNNNSAASNLFSKFSTNQSFYNPQYKQLKFLPPSFVLQLQSANNSNLLVNNSSNNNTSKCASGSYNTGLYGPAPDMTSYYSLPMSAYTYTTHSSSPANNGPLSVGYSSNPALLHYPPTIAVGDSSVGGSSKLLLTLPNQGSKGTETDEEAVQQPTTFVSRENSLNLEMAQRKSSNNANNHNGISPTRYASNGNNNNNHNSSGSFLSNHDSTSTIVGNTSSSSNSSPTQPVGTGKRKMSDKIGAMVTENPSYTTSQEDDSESDMIAEQAPCIAPEPVDYLKKPKPRPKKRKKQSFKPLTVLVLDSHVPEVQAKLKEIKAIGESLVTVELKYALIQGGFTILVVVVLDNQRVYLGRLSDYYKQYIKASIDDGTFLYAELAPLPEFSIVDGVSIIVPQLNLYRSISWGIKRLSELEYMSTVARLRNDEYMNKTRGQQQQKQQPALPSALLSLPHNATSSIASTAVPPSIAPPSTSATINSNNDIPFAMPNLSVPQSTPAPIATTAGAASFLPTTATPTMNSNAHVFQNPPPTVLPPLATTSANASPNSFGSNAAPIFLPPSRLPSATFGGGSPLPAATVAPKSASPLLSTPIAGVSPFLSMSTTATTSLSNLSTMPAIPVPSGVPSLDALLQASIALQQGSTLTGMQATPSHLNATNNHLNLFNSASSNSPRPSSVMPAMPTANLSANPLNLTGQLTSFVPSSSVNPTFPSLASPLNQDATKSAAGLSNLLSLQQQALLMSQNYLPASNSLPSISTPNAMFKSIVPPTNSFPTNPTLGSSSALTTIPPNFPPLMSVPSNNNNSEFAMSLSPVALSPQITSLSPQISSLPPSPGLSTVPLAPSIPTVTNSG